MVDSTKENINSIIDNVSAKDKLRYVNSWMMLIMKAQQARADGDSLTYTNTIDTYIDSLFKRERVEVKDTFAKIKAIPGMNALVAYDEIFQYTNDLLHDRKYLTAGINWSIGGGQDVVEEEDKQPPPILGGYDAEHVQPPTKPVKPKSYGLEPL